MFTCCLKNFVLVYCNCFYYACIHIIVSLPVLLHVYNYIHARFWLQRHHYSFSFVPVGPLSQFIKVHGASPLRLLVLVSARLSGGGELASRACAVTAVFKRLSTAAGALVCVTCVDDHNLFCRVNGAAGGSESLDCATQGKIAVSEFTCGRNKTWAELDLPDFSYAGMAIGDRYDDKPDTKGWKVAGLELARHIWSPLS